METRICQNQGKSLYCMGSFDITSDDFDFYKKINVPVPTFCPICRLQRRMMFRNERSLYRRTCDLCQKDIITVHAPEKKRTVFCGKCWWSDLWDPLDYGVDYDPKKSFFLQLKELQEKIPLMDRVVDHGTLINSDYINHAGSCKNCTLIYNADYCENVLYSSSIVYSRDSLDIYAGDHIELSYEITDGEKCSRCFFSKSLVSCVDVYFSRDCTGCMNCFGCINLRNKNYHVFNKPVSREEFEKVVASYNLGKREGIERARTDTNIFFKTQPKRCVYGQKNQNVLGNYIYNSKNAMHCWSGQYYEDCAYCQFSTLPYTRDSYDFTEWGNNAEQVVDTINAGENVSNIKYCVSVWGNARNIEYSMFCTSGLSDLFGCISLRKKSYCILNKQYTQEEYEKLREQIISDMNKNPYIDRNNRVWKYGDFFPYDVSIYDYNESWAMQHFPLTRDQVLEIGSFWRDQPKNSYTPTIKSLELETISNINDTILDEIIECKKCKRCYKILLSELELLKRFNLALPDQCPNCRSDDRLSQIGTAYLYMRTCDRCGIETQSGYSEDSTEIVYCEKCYQQEII